MPPNGCATYMTGRFRFGKMSTGMRTTARIEQRASAITNTMIVRGRRRAARRSHILTVLPAFYRVETAGTARDHRGMLRPKPSSAKPRAAQEHRRSLLARAGSGRLRHPPALPAQLGNVLVLGSRRCGMRLARTVCSRRHGATLQEKPVLSAIAPSGLAGLDRSERPRHVHLPIQRAFENGSRRCRILEM